MRRTEPAVRGVLLTGQQHARREPWSGNAESGRYLSAPKRRHVLTAGVFARTETAALPAAGFRGIRLLDAQEKPSLSGTERAAAAGGGHEREQEIISGKIKTANFNLTV